MLFLKIQAGEHVETNQQATGHLLKVLLHQAFEVAEQTSTLAKTSCNTINCPRRAKPAILPNKPVKVDNFW